MIKNITVGQYIPGDSFIHNLDPRIKIIFTAFFVILLFMVNKLSGYIFIMAFLVLSIYISRIPLKFVFRGLKPIVFIIFITILANALFTPGEVIWSYGIISITKEGLWSALLMGLRLIFLIIGTSLLTFTTSPIMLTDGIEYLLKPFRRIGVPAHEIAMMMTIALRFIPTLFEETEKIMKAQMARGADFESGNFIKRIKNLIPILIPLFINAFRRADELALAMESRCYRGGENRTRMKELKFTAKDISALLIMFAFAVVIILNRFWKW